MNPWLEVALLTACMAAIAAFMWFCDSWQSGPDRTQVRHWFRFGSAVNHAVNSIADCDTMTVYDRNYRPFVTLTVEPERCKIVVRFHADSRHIGKRTQRLLVLRAIRERGYSIAFHRQ